MDTAPEFYAPDRPTWRAWLAEHHASMESMWLIYDKGPGRQLSYDDIVEEALCFGWIDSRPGTLSDTQSKLYISRRKPRSAWSAANKLRVEQLLAAGQIEPAGLAAIEIAKSNGAWDALNKSDNFEVPDDLAQALKASSAAQKFYDTMPPSSQKIILEWIYSAKRPQTRQARITETVELAAKGIRAHHYRQ